MRICFIITFLLFCLQSFSQAGYNIFYVVDNSDIPFVVSGVPVKRPLVHTRLVCNDVVSYNYGLGTGKRDPMNKSKEYGSKVVNHAVMAFKDSSFHYVGVAYPPGIKHFFLIDTLKKREWTFTGESKKILGYDCMKAFWVKEYMAVSDTGNTWRSDSTIAWYAEEIALPFGPGDNRGLPGLVLEVVNPGPFGKTRTYAIDIRKEDIMIEIAPSIPVISYSEFMKSKR